MVSEKDVYCNKGKAHWRTNPPGSRLNISGTCTTNELTSCPVSGFLDDSVPVTAFAALQIVGTALVGVCGLHEVVYYHAIVEGLFLK